MSSGFPTVCVSPITVVSLNSLGLILKTQFASVEYFLSLSVEMWIASKSELQAGWMYGPYIPEMTEGDGTVEFFSHFDQ